VEVSGVDPAGASLDVARAKPGADRVRWLHGDATTLPPMQVDVATMTANVAQVFLTDEEWRATLSGIHAAVRPGGHLVVETRVPERQAWLEWQREASYTRTHVDGAGEVESWVDLDEVRGDLVSFTWTIRFADDGATYRSPSTLRFRSRGQVESSLRGAGFEPLEVRDAPDRPGRELVFVARRT
jgi:SAM-dependent methyltransferase